jgi:hypothetical protein
MQTWLVDLILLVAAGAVFLIALRGRKIGSLTIASRSQKIDSPTGPGSFKGGPLGKFFDMFWGWADYKPQDWSNAPYKRDYRK